LRQFSTAVAFLHGINDKKTATTKAGNGFSLSPLSGGRAKKTLPLFSKDKVFLVPFKV
jgi:hypothetical protein